MKTLIHSSEKNGALFPRRIGQYEGGMARKHFWDYSEERDPQRQVRQLMGEERMWANLLVLSIQDYKGVSKHALKECIDCHKAEHPECFKVGERGNGRPYLYRFNRACKDWHTITECANDWIFSDSTEERSYRWVCDLLGIEPTYLRANLNNRAFEDYWKDEARINTFLGFASGKENGPGSGPNSHVYTGHPGEAGDED